MSMNGQVATNPYCGVVAKFFEARMAGLPMTIYGDGSQTRDFTYIDDAVHVILLAAEREAAIGETLNVATGIETSVLGLSTEIGKVFGDAQVNQQFATKRTVDTISRRCLDIGRTREVLNWDPAFTLEEGIKHTHDWIMGGQK